MRKQLIGAVSAAALLLSGAAFAQSSGGSAGGTSGGTATDKGSQQTTTTTRSEPASPSTTPRSGTTSTDSATQSGSSAGATSGTTSRQSTAGAGTAGSAGAMKADKASAEQLLGKTVVGANGDEIGEVKDVILDPKTGQAKQLIIGSGGFLGIGEKNIPVDFAEAQIQPGQDNITVSSLSREQVRDMKGFEYDESTVSLTRGEGSGGSAGRQGGSGGSAGQSQGQQTQTEKTTTTTTTRPTTEQKPKSE